MKKILTLIAAILLLNSCEIPISSTVNTQEDYIRLVISDPFMDGDTYKRTFSIIKFDYEGHNYIYMKMLDCDGHSIVHDPNCPCHNQEQQKTTSRTTKFSWEQ